MFEIDLKSSAARQAAIARSEPAAGVGGFAPVAIGLAVLLLGLWAVNGWIEDRIARQEQTVAGLEAAVAAAREQLAEISGKRRALYDMQREEIYWSDQLRLLSEKVPDKLWISEVKVVTAGGDKNLPPSRTLTFQGGVLSSPSEGNLDLIGRFIQDLQADPRFQGSFHDLVLESVTRAGDPHSMGFILRASFRGQA